MSSASHEPHPVGITDVFIVGSFAEDKDHSNDIDGYSECELDHLRTGALELTRDRSS